jgi:hypothetical protein
MKIFINKWFGVIIVCVLYILYSFLILKPSLYSNFSLIDDGQTIQNTISFNKCFNAHVCSDLSKVLIEKEFGRFRPGYWATNYVVFSVIGLNPILLHQVRIYIIGLIIVVLLGLLVVKSGGNKLALIISSVFFFISYSFSENIIRLGPVEPFQIIGIALMSYFYLYENKNKWIWVYFFYGYSILIKETSVVSLLPILITTYFSKSSKIERRKAIGMLLLGISIFIISRFLSKPPSTAIAYSENFQISFRMIVNNFSQYLQIVLNSTSPFLKSLVFVYLILIIFLKKTKTLIDKHIIYWVVASLVYAGILVPWKYVLERYILISLFSISIVVGIVITQIQNIINEYILLYKIKYIHRLGINLIFIFILINMIFAKFPIDYAKTTNYRNWYSDFLRFESDQVAAIVNTRSNVVFVDATDSIDNWEVLFELPIHIRTIYNSDLLISRIDKIPESGYIFVRKQIETSVSENDLRNSGFKVISSGNYIVNQIDPVKFRDQFKYRPLTALKYPDLNPEPYKYSWFIYFKK